jgi:hypothetical protein
VHRLRAAGDLIRADDRDIAKTGFSSFGHGVFLNCHQCQEWL